MKKLKDILNESQHLSYQRMNVGEEKEEKGMTNEEKREFLKAVAEYKRFGESIYRSGNLAEVYESIKGIVETAHKVTLEETGDWFDKVTVGRHMKSMNESFKVFEKTISEVNTLQQRLESCYDEMGEVLGKYYEIKEGNEFGAERAKAIAKGKDEFEVDGKKFPVTDVDKEDKENAKDFAKESVNEGKHDSMLDKLADMVKGVDFMNVGKELKKNGIKYSFSTSMIPMYKIDKLPIAIVNKKYAAGAEREVGDIAIGLMESIKEEKSMKLTDILSENKYSIIDPKGNQKGVGPKDAANKRAKALGGAKKGYFVVPAKSALKARRAMEKYKFDFKNAKLQDMMSDLYFEGVEAIDEFDDKSMKAYGDAVKKAYGVKGGATAIWVGKTTKIDPDGKSVIIKKGDKGEVIRQDYRDQYLVRFGGRMFYAHLNKNFKLDESVNEESINEIGVLGVASGVALGLVGVIALSKGVGFAKRKFGDAMYNVADKMEKKVKKIESDNAKKAIMDIAKKFENDAKLQGMYQSLPAYKDGGKNSERKKGMAEIAKYVKSKLSSDEMQYFYDLNTYLRTNKIKGTLVAPEKKSAFQKRLDKLGADNAHLSNESVNEGASTEEKRIVMMAVKKIAKYRNVPLNYAVGDVMRAAQELERDIKKGKVKK